MFYICYFLLFAVYKYKNVCKLDVDLATYGPVVGTSGVAFAKTEDPLYIGGIPRK